MEPEGFMVTKVPTLKGALREKCYGKAIFPC